MVGFGSSLRIGRRAGWEAAYLDYETLKLLLSQIESVYEEEGHHGHRTRDVFMGEPDGDDDSSRQRQERRDFRDELFLESDSDVAFASSQSNEEDLSSSDTTVYKKDHQHRSENMQKMLGNHPQGGRPFNLMYSHEEASSSSDDSYSGGGNNNCGAVHVPWRSEKPAALKSHQRKRSKSKKRFNDARETTGLETFIMDEGSESYDPTERTTYTSSLFNAPFQLGVSTEETALLSHGSLPQDVNTFFSFSSGISATPPKDQYAAGASISQDSSQNMMYTSSVSHFLSAQKSSPAGMGPKVSKLDDERRRERRQRRRRKLARQRREREKRVPKHIRLAHSKARNITERFLGLVRAEVEKVTLFAQARLGELADTAGSLRFLSSEELTELSGTFVGRANTSSYEHPLSDGGIHPSASSSSDEGAGGQGVFPWSDSSSDDDASKGSNRLNIPNNFSGGTTPQTENLNTRGDLRARSISPVKHLANKQTELLESTRRKIEHFEDIRRKRPIFQRNDHIVGEDLLLVSAVDEADAYSAVGVELMHILKYICINVIAVRKICRKHDKLLMNRMLGGYYHRKRTTRAQEEQTLGGLIAHVAGDIPHPALMGLVNHGKLMGVYDLKIQHLANSRTVKVISSCLALALSEYEVSRTRADALARLNSSQVPPATSVPAMQKQTEGYSSPLGSFDLKSGGWAIRGQDRADARRSEAREASQFSDGEDGDGPPSTASSMSLTRLRFTVLSIAALREASRFKSDSFTTYLSRTALSFSGLAVVGEGLDGCSRETLDFLVSFSPDASILLDSSALFEGLRRGRWRQLSIGSVMRSSLAVALNTSSQKIESQATKRYLEEEIAVMNALSLLPQSEGIDSSGPLENTALPLSISMSITRFVDFPPEFLRINRTALFLYTVNYFIVHATVNTFVLESGANVAYSAAIVGAANLSALVAAAFHYYFLSQNGRSSSRSPKVDFAPVRNFLALSAVAAICGNLIHIHGIRNSSVPYSVLGRFVMGFAAADIVHKHFVTMSMPPSLIVPESARLVQIQVAGLITGLLLGSATELLPFRTTVDPEILLPMDPSLNGVKSIQLANWLMIFLWTIQFLRVVCFGRPTGGRNGGNFHNNKNQNNNMNDDSQDGAEYYQIADHNSSDSSISDGETGPAELFRRPEDTLVVEGGDTRSVDSGGGGGGNEPTTGMQHSRSFRRSDTNNNNNNGGMKRRKQRKVGSLLKRIRRLVSYNVTVSITLALTVYTAFAHEVLFTSCALIADQYFKWRGNIAGVFLGSLSVLILPIDFVSEQIARRYEERTTIKRSILLLGIGLLVMVNWGSVFALTINIRNLLTETKDTRQHHYDWLLGIPQYTIGFTITFVGLRALGGASRSLLSKVSPVHIMNTSKGSNNNNTVANLGTVVTFVSLISQFIANFQITMVGLSHRVINTDIVNALIVPMLIGCLVAYYFVRKHYFFMM